MKILIVNTMKEIFKHYEMFAKLIGIYVHLSNARGRFRATNVMHNPSEITRCKSLRNSHIWNWIFTWNRKGIDKNENYWETTSPWYKVENIKQHHFESLHWCFGNCRRTQEDGPTFIWDRSQLFYHQCFLSFFYG